MIFSMTGFSSFSSEFDGGSLSVELRAVNHRYLDIQIRIPDELRMMEPVLRETITAQITRGKVECRINISNHLVGQNAVQLNQALLLQLAGLSKTVRDILPDAEELSVADVLRWEGVLQCGALPTDVLCSSVRHLLQQALLEFGAARCREGEKLKAFLAQRVKQLADLCLTVAPRIPAAITAFEAKLAARLRTAMQNDDSERLRQEVSLFASKIDVIEELARLQVHLDEFNRILAQGGPVGKRLDFLVQELHREANTLGAKSVDGTVSLAAMEMKLLIEQMREQIQNIE